MQAVDNLDKALDAQGCYLGGGSDQGIELWAADGWRIGILVYEDDYWRFRIDYADAPLHPVEEGTI